VTELGVPEISTPPPSDHAEAEGEDIGVSDAEKVAVAALASEDDNDEDYEDASDRPTSFTESERIGAELFDTSDFDPARPWDRE
jgi:hypothetical protein